MAVDLTRPVAQALTDLHTSLIEARKFDIGFPGAVDLAFPDLAELLTTQLLNNVGDPYDLGHGRNHTKLVEQRVVETVANLLRAPAGRWGYVTTGATEANLHALDEAWQRYPDTVIYTSTAAHYSVVKAARLLKLPLIIVRADKTGQMDYDDLAGQLDMRRERAAAIVATAGTTMTEAIDNVARIVATCDRLAVTRRRIHVDAALSGIPLALLPDQARPAFDFVAGATSMVVSGHKFLSTLMPCGILIYAQSPYTPVNGRVSYTGSADTTISGSRNGHTPLILWHVLQTLGVDGLRARAEASRKLAIYAHRQITKLGWPTRLNPHAFTVVLRTPPQAVRDKWVLPDDGQWSHIVCVPGVTAAQVDEFVADLRTATTPASRRRLLPRQRHPTPASATLAGEAR
ncbi:MAG TPA: histidine decarboxylase [Micromonosporaceae bacterium]|nr:histidine decarboxylase [Micromonosporaceae bacterium]